MFRFQDPWAWALLAPLLLALWVRRRRRGERDPKVTFPLVSDALAAGRGFWAHVGRAVPWLEAMALVLLVAGLARPQAGLTETDVTTEGVDIVLAVDTSGSMLAEDFSEGAQKRKNRLDVAKETIARFIRGRHSDRIGLVVFAENAYTKVPLTLDYPLLLDLLDEVDIDRRAGKTAIGMALATAANRLKHSEAESRIIILLTDGRNNTGAIAPMDAAGMAAKMGLKVYTIGVGRKGPVPFPRDDPIFGRAYTLQRVDIDEDTLLDIARRTGGVYFRAEDLGSLREVFDTIDELETSELVVKEYSRYRELFAWFLLPGLGVLATTSLLLATRLRRLP